MSDASRITWSGVFVGFLPAALTAIVSILLTRQIDAHDHCVAAVALLQTDVDQLLARDEETRPKWDQQMERLLKEPEANLETSRSWLMQDYRFLPLTNGEGVQLAVALPGSALGPALNFYRLTGRLNGEITVLSDIPILESSTDLRRERIDENNGTRMAWVKAAMELKSALNEADCPWGLFQL